MTEYINGNGLKNTLENLTKGQTDIENILKDGFDRTEKSLNQIANEIRQTRESGYISAPIVEKLLDHQSKGSDKTYKILTLIFGAFLAAVLGLKAFFPQILGG